MTSHKYLEWQSERPRFRKQCSLTPNVSLITLGNRTYNRRNESLTLGSESGLIHAGRNKTQRPIQSSAWTPEPFDPHSELLPLTLEVIPVPVVDWFQMQGTTVLEVQARPQQHAGIVA